MNCTDSITHMSRQSRIKRWLREPLLHFLLIGLALFIVNGLLSPEGSRVDRQEHIVVTDDDLVQLELVWRAKWQRPPTPEEMVAMVDNKIKEEILYREALVLGLDRDDTIVKRRLAQKMEFLSEDVSAIQDPGVDELRAWFDDNSGNFALPGRISFRHLYFSPDKRGVQARETALEVLQKLNGKAADKSETDNLADPFMFQNYYGDRSPTQLASEFGGRFAEAVFQLKPGTWHGPIESGLGWHLVWVDSLTPGRVPAFEEVEAQARDQWIGMQRENVRREAFAAMRDRYEIVLPTSSERETAGIGEAIAAEVK